MDSQRAFTHVEISKFEYEQLKTKIKTLEKEIQF